MELGGEDFILEGPTSEEDWLVFFVVIKREWPSYATDAITSTEAFIYRNERALAQEYAPDEVPSGFIHVLMGPECFTAVLDTEETESRRVGLLAFEAVRERKGHTPDRLEPF